MQFTTQQIQTIKADISANSDLNTKPNTPDGADAIAALYNSVVSPDFFVWRTSVNEDDITGQVSLDATSWSWTPYINRSQGERDAWMRLFRSGKTNPSLLNVRTAISDIFSGAGGSAQRAHVIACFRRKATRLEKLLADTSGGNGVAATPATLTVEGSINYEQVLAARNW